MCTGVWGIRDGEAAVLNFTLTDYPELETWLTFSQDQRLKRYLLLQKRVLRTRVFEGTYSSYPAKDGCFSANKSVKGQEVRKVGKGREAHFH